MQPSGRPSWTTGSESNSAWRACRKRSPACITVHAGVSGSTGITRRCRPVAGVAEAGCAMAFMGSRLLAPLCATGAARYPGDASRVLRLRAGAAVFHGILLQGIGFCIGVARIGERAQAHVHEPRREGGFDPVARAADGIADMRIEIEVALHGGIVAIVRDERAGDEFGD